MTAKRPTPPPPSRPTGPRLGLRRIWCVMVALAPGLHSTPLRAQAAPHAAAWQAVVEPLLSRHGMAGLGLTLVHRDGEWLSDGLGVSDFASGQRVDGDTAFCAGSISKTLVALGILALVADGRLHLEDRLADVAPEIAFTNPWQATQPITVTHLLEHTHGAEAIAGSWFLAPGDQRPRLVDLVTDPFAFPRHAQRPPGSIFQYNNYGYVLATYLIEKISGFSYEQFIAERILKPVGMRHSGFLPRIGGQPLATPYYPGTRRPVARLELTVPAVGGMISTARDMGRLLRCLLGEGRIDGQEVLPAHLVRRAQQRMTGPGAAYQWPTGFNLGMTYVSTPLGIMYMHHGKTDGYGGYFAYSPARDLGFAMLTNTHFGLTAMEPIATAIMMATSTALGVAAPPPPEPEIPLPPSLAASLPGTYVDAASLRIFQLFRELVLARQVEVRAGQVFMHTLFGSERRLIPVGPWALREEGLPAASIFMIPDAAPGTPVMLDGVLQFERTSTARIQVLRIVVVVSLLGLLSALRFASTLMRRRRLGLDRRDWPEGLAIGAAAAFCVQMAALVIILKDGTIAAAMTPRLGPRIFCYAPYAEAALAIAALAAGLARLGRVDDRPFIHQLLSAAAGVAVAVILARYGLIGMRYW